MTEVKVNAGARLDRLPASGFHRKLAVLIGAGMFFDGFDLFLAANVLGALSQSGFSNLRLNGHTGYAMFVPELFPTDVRLRGVGFCHTIGRVAGALIPLAVVPIYLVYGIGGVVTMMAGFLIVQAVVVWTLAVEPKFQSLEALDLADAPPASLDPAIPKVPGLRQATKE